MGQHYFQIYVSSHGGTEHQRHRGEVGCPLRVVPPGQPLRRPRTPSPCDKRMFGDLLNFVRSICELFFRVWTVFLYVDVLLHFLVFGFSSI